MKSFVELITLCKTSPDRKIRRQKIFRLLANTLRLLKKSISKVTDDNIHELIRLQSDLIEHIPGVPPLFSKQTDFNNDTFLFINIMPSRTYRPCDGDDDYLVVICIKVNEPDTWDSLESSQFDVDYEFYCSSLDELSTIAVRVAYSLAILHKVCPHTAGLLDKVVKKLENSRIIKKLRSS
jgi:hypothetical protein